MKSILSVLIFGSLLVVPAHAQVAYRFTDMDLMDPHVFTALPLIGCSDITNGVPLGLGTPFNGTLEESITMDGDGDGFLDMNPILYFFGEDDAVGTGPGSFGSSATPLGPGGQLALHFGSCTAPMVSTMCDANPANEVYRVDYTNSIPGDCFTSIPGTLKPYEPAILPPAGPCFITDPFIAKFDVAGILIELLDARVTADYVGDPAMNLVSGVISGFLSEAYAEETLLPKDTPLIGGQTLSTILPGGLGCCATHDDRDFSPDGQTLGWWLYLSFEAEEVAFTAATAAPVATVGAPSSVHLSGAAPNPLRERTSFFFTIPTAGQAHVRVVDVRGRSLKTLWNATAGPGTHTVVWDGTDRLGVPVVSGVYFVRLDTVGGSATSRIVVSR